MAKIKEMENTREKKVEDPYNRYFRKRIEKRL